MALCKHFIGDFFKFFSDRLRVGAWFNLVYLNRAVAYLAARNN